MTPRRSWLAALAGLALAGPAVFDLVTRWDVLWAGHLAFPITLAVAVLLGLGLIVRGLRVRERRGGVLKAVGAVLGLACAIGLGATFWYLQPIPATYPFDAKPGTTDGVTLATSPTRITLTPEGRINRVLVFYPGARIDPRAYVRILRPIAAAGTEVRIVKEPFNLALLDPAAASNDLRNVPAGQRAVAGHSLGGVVAASDAAALNARLVLWASYPSGSIADSGIAATSIYGSADGLATPEQVRRAGALLPKGATLVEIDGATHGSFGDFGRLAGDGSDGGAHRELQEQIERATMMALS